MFWGAARRCSLYIYCIGENQDLNGAEYMVTNQLYSTESYPHILESNRLKTGASAPFCQSTEGNCVYSRKRSLCS